MKKDIEEANDILEQEKDQDKVVTKEKENKKLKIITSIVIFINIILFISFLLGSKYFNQVNVSDKEKLIQIMHWKVFIIEK